MRRESDCRAIEQTVLCGLVSCPCCRCWCENFYAARHCISVHHNVEVPTTEPCLLFVASRAQRVACLLKRTVCKHAIALFVPGSHVAWTAACFLGPEWSGHFGIDYGFFLNDSVLVCAFAMATEATAVQILQTRLEAEGGSAPITSLSVKVKWGQHELQGFGHIRKFLSKHHEVFTLEGSSVALVKSVAIAPQTVPKTTSKFAPKAPPTSLAPSPKEFPLKRSSAETDASLKKVARTSREDVNGTGTSQTSARGRNIDSGEMEVIPVDSTGSGRSTRATLLATAKTAPKVAAKIGSKVIAPTPKGTANVAKIKEAKDTKDGKFDGDAKDEGSSDARDAAKSGVAKEPAPWHAQRALTRAAMQVGPTARQDMHND